ncbi:MAG: hypothetical protein V2G42_05910 [bacterium JZ-2024 1]
MAFADGGFNEHPLPSAIVPAEGKSDLGRPREQASPCTNVRTGENLLLRKRPPIHDIKEKNKPDCRKAEPKD